MTIHNMKTTTFPDVDFGHWKETASKSLKGKPFDQLITRTIEGIDLHPLYTAEDLITRADDALVKTIASIRESKQGTGWIVAQQQYAKDGKEFVSELKNSIERGNEAIVYDGSKPLEWDACSLSDIAGLMTRHPIFISNTIKNDPFLEVFDLIPTAKRQKIQGTVLASGWNKPAGYSNVRSIGADTWTEHHKGADAVTELALTIAQAAELATEHNSFSTFAESFFVRFAVDTHFFLEIAKLRAFRILWHAFSSAFDEVGNAYVPILVETSLRSYSKLDPYVNLLRAGNETFSAVLGGADVVTVHPHNLLTSPTASSIRLARNVQLIIKEETYVEKVIDPSGGSYFIETLTVELAEKAWNLFLDIESAGGYSIYVSSGELEKLLKRHSITRKDQVAKGEKSLVGTNAYADLDETVATAQHGYQMEDRLAEAFEKSRAYFSTSQPKTVLLTFGELIDFKPRADFVSGFLATGGIHSEWSPKFIHTADALDWLAVEKPDYAIVCASPEVTEELIDELLTGLPSGMTLDLAGKYDTTLSKQWTDAGLSGFIFKGQDKIMKFKEIKHKWKGVEKK